MYLLQIHLTPQIIMQLGFKYWHCIIARPMQAVPQIVWHDNSERLFRQAFEHLYQPYQPKTEI